MVRHWDVTNITCLFAAQQGEDALGSESVALRASRLLFVVLYIVTYEAAAGPARNFPRGVS